MTYEILKECLYLLNKMSPYLLFGFLVAGIIHIFIKEDVIVKHLGKNNFLSVLKASLFGIPLPLCSCSVVPTALSLKRDGACKGSILSFLVSTPTTGIDSIFATYSLMGGLFAVFRIIASFFAGVLAGILSVLFDSNESAQKNAVTEEKKSCCHHHSHVGEDQTLLAKVKGALNYAFNDLLDEVGGWLILGILLGGIISYFVPVEFINKYLGSLWISILVMMVVGIPMYVCSSGSLPIAAALMMKGLNPAAAFVFLFVGPATNSASLTLIFKDLGFKSAIIFLLSIVITSVSFGIFLDYLWNYYDINLIKYLEGSGQMIPVWVEGVSSVLLIGLILLHAVRKFLNRFTIRH